MKSDNICLSGAVLDPRAMDELLPDWRDEAPLDAQVTHEDSTSLRKTNPTGSFDASANAGPRQLRDLAQSLCEMAGRKS